MYEKMYFFFEENVIQLKQTFQVYSLKPWFHLFKMYIFPSAPHNFKELSSKQ